MARHHWPGEDPVGRRITFDDLDKNPQWITVVGVARDAARSDWAAPPEEEMYLPLLQSQRYLESPAPHYTYLTVVARTRSEPGALVPALREAVRSADRGVTLSEVQTMDEVVARSTASPRFYLLLLGTFAVVALALAAVGIYGVMSYSVARRTNEIGIRMALGARPADVMRLVLRETVMVAMMGTMVGLAVALLLARLMGGLLYGVAATDPATFASVCAVLTTVALAATYVPARRAIRVDPLAALRAE
jgi:putative ABC transport system permease protein